MASVDSALADTQARQSPLRVPHIAVCICTYKRPALLLRLLAELDRQETEGRFTLSAVVVDNDETESALPAIEQFRAASSIPVKYLVEKQRGIAFARNKVVASAEGDYLAFIDDDEFPVRRWLVTLLENCNKYGVSGVLGPVRRHFDQEPPKWIAKSQLYERRINPTGTPVEWKEARTGNVLIRRSILPADEPPFRTEFRMGEDQDFFRRMMERGHKFIWSSDAIAYEVVPPQRWDRVYILRKALLRGATARLQADCGPKSIAKSVIAVPLYTLALPFALLAGQDKFMTLFMKTCDHLGKLFAVVGFNPVREEYVNE
jgi:succinoglycan biosynthesis protein ExoM